MSDEVRLTAGIGRGVNRQIGDLPKARRRKTSETKEKKETKTKTSTTKTPKGKTGIHGESKGSGAHGESPINVPSERIYPKGPGPLSGGQKAITPPAPKSLEAPGPFVAAPLVNLNEGPDFGKTVYDITRLPRQFKQ